jgi:FKBP-type peptidyl-prolyl cis-trans isomerase
MCGDGAAAVPSGLRVKGVTLGSGDVAERGCTVSIRWRGGLNRGDEFGSGKVTFRIGDRRVVAGLEKGVVGMRVGGVRQVQVSPHLGHRDRAVPGIPPNAVLSFEVELLAVSV